MADALDSKSSDRKVVGVQVPPPVLLALGPGRSVNDSSPFFRGTQAQPTCNGCLRMPRDCAARHPIVWAGDLSSGRYQPSLATCKRSAAIRLTALRIARMVDSTVSVLAPVPR